jgi:hypothetical protein
MWSRFGLPAAIAATLAIVRAFVPTSAVAATVNYQLTVTESAPTMVYGNPTVSFRGYLTVPSDDPPLAWNTPFYIAVDSQTYSGSVSGTYPTYTLYQAGLVSPGPSVGQHSVTAQYLSPKHGLLTSAPVVLTVLKTTPSLDCTITNITNTYAVNTPFTIHVQFGGINGAVDIQNGTFSITFIGPRTFTSPNLSANSAGQVFASAPSATGVYQTKCAFSGTGSVNPVETHLNIPTIIVSANNPVGGISLYTNPTPVTHGPMITWEVVVSPRSGLPTPTGNIGVDIGVSYTKLMPLGPGGRMTFQAVAPTLYPSDTIRVWFMGDPVYASSSADFPLTTPPIPGNAVPSTGTAVSNAGSAPTTTTPAPTPTPTAAESPTALPQAIVLPSPSNRFNGALAGSTEHSRPGGVRALYLVGALASLTLVGLAGGLAWRQRRRRRT